MRFVKKTGGSREATEAPTPSAWPRICTPTWRNLIGKPYQCGLYEAQDVLVEIDDVDLICLERDSTWRARVKSGLLSRALHHDICGKLIFANPGLKKVKLC